MAFKRPRSAEVGLKSAKIVSYAEARTGPQGVRTVFPVLDSLETVHHGTIETVGSRDHDHRRDEEVELSETGFLVPSDHRELSSTEDILIALGCNCAGSHC